MPIPKDIKETLLEGIDDSEIEFESRISAFGDYSDEDIAKRKAEFAAAREWLNTN